MKKHWPCTSLDMVFIQVSAAHVALEPSILQTDRRPLLLAFPCCVAGILIFLPCELGGAVGWA